MNSTSSRDKPQHIMNVCIRIRSSVVALLMFPGAQSYEGINSLSERASVFYCACLGISLLYLSHISLHPGNKSIITACQSASNLRSDRWSWTPVVSESNTMWPRLLDLIWWFCGEWSRGGAAWIYLWLKHASFNKQRKSKFHVLTLGKQCSAEE